MSPKLVDTYKSVPYTFASLRFGILPKPWLMMMTDVSLLHLCDLAYHQNVTSSTITFYNTIYCTLITFLDCVCLATSDGNSPACCSFCNHSIQFIRIIASVIIHLIIDIFKLNFFNSCIASSLKLII